MDEKEKRILDTFVNDVIPRLSNLDKEKLLAFGEGLAFMANQNQSRNKTTEEQKSPA